MNATVKIYNLQTSDGRHIRQATRVVFEDGIEIYFVEKLGKAEAIRPAKCQREKRAWCEVVA